MRKNSKSRMHRLLGIGFCLAAFDILGCHASSPLTIALIPQTTGTDLWNPERAGALSVARKANAQIYWNAPTQEDDVEAQIDLLERITRRKHLGGIVLSPDQAIALTTPVRRAVAAGIPVVVVSSPLGIPPGPKLSYILNDDELGGRLAAGRVARLLHGKGSVAIMGIDTNIGGVMIRLRSFETALAAEAPGIKIVARRTGSYNVTQEQQVADEILQSNPGLNVIVSLTSAAMRGAFVAVSGHEEAGVVKLIGFDQDIALDSIQTGKIDAVVVQDTYHMGAKAVQTILDEIHNKPVPAEIKLAPTLVTKENLSTPRIRQILSLDWSLQR